MITNTSLTIYHQNGIDATTRLTKWQRFNYNKVWYFGGRGAGISKGYDNANDVEIRLPYDKNANLDVSNFALGDIIVKGTLNNDITKQSDLSDYEIYNITSIKNNDFGINKHIHLGGK